MHSDVAHVQAAEQRQLDCYVATSRPLAIFDVERRTVVSEPMLSLLISSSDVRSIVDDGGKTRSIGVMRLLLDHHFFLCTL